MTLRMMYCTILITDVVSLAIDRQKKFSYGRFGNLSANSHFGESFLFNYINQMAVLIRL